MTTITDMEEARFHLDAVVQDWLSHDDTPGWCHGLVQAAADFAATAYDLLHLHTDLVLCERIMEGNSKADLEAWSSNDQVPDWFREALVAFSFADSKWAQNRVLADLDTVKTIIEERIGYTP